jgi:hypothetical protein
MTANGYVQLAFYLIVLLLLAKPLGTYDIFACMADGGIDGRIVVNLQ